MVSRESSLKRIRFLRRSQWWSHDRILDYQFHRFKSLLRHAYGTTEYYRRVLDDRGICPEDITRHEDIASLPTITKADLHEHMESMVSSAFGKNDLNLNSSGGSTGVVTSLYQDTHRNWLRSADIYRHDCWTGWKIGEPVFRAWGARSDFLSMTGMSSRIRRTMLGPLRVLNAFELTDDKAKDFLEEMASHSRFLLVGYASALRQLARVAAECRGIRCRPLGVIPSAETLTDEARKEIEDAFKCGVFNRYGSRETGLMASECEAHTGMHINAEGIFLEVSEDETYDDHMGKVVVTDLENYGMPLIRYEIGDVARLSGVNCACGRGLPLLEKVQGRVSGFVTSITIDMVKAASCDEEKLGDILKKIHKAVGEDIKLTHTFVDHIPTPPSGKYQYVISHCS
jgi:phenylacetate-CoA ligase